MKPRLAWAALVGLVLAAAAHAELVLPIKFVPVQANDSTLFPLYANTSLFGVFITGLDFGTPPQELQLLIDTGSGITHVAGAGCGSSCGLGLPETAGYNASASSTSQAVPCGDACSCPHCLCATEGMQEPSCAYGLQYADGSSSSGGLVQDVVNLGGVPVDMVFGVQERQTGVLQGMGIDGLLGLDRTSKSFVAQLRSERATKTGAGEEPKPVAFGTCWELEYNGFEQGYPDRNASSFLMLGLPPAIEQSLQPSWTPLLEGPPAQWGVGLVAVEVLGPGGGNITAELYPSPVVLPGANSSNAAAGGGAAALLSRALPVPGAGGLSATTSGSSQGVLVPGAAQAAGASEAERYGGAVMDSGATYTHLPRPAWRRFMELVSSAAEARGRVKRKVAREGVVCWEGLEPSTLTSNASALDAAFPTLQLHFQGGAAFNATPTGYLVAPDTGGAHLACLSVFPWDADLSLLGSRIRRRVVTLHDDTGERVGFVNVAGCEDVADAWREAS